MIRIIAQGEIPGRFLLLRLVALLRCNVAIRSIIVRIIELIYNSIYHNVSWVIIPLPHRGGGGCLLQRCNMQHCNTRACIRLIRVRTRLIRACISLIHICIRLVRGCIGCFLLQKRGEKSHESDRIVGNCDKMTLVEVANGLFEDLFRDTKTVGDGFRGALVTQITVPIVGF